MKKRLAILLPSVGACILAAFVFVQLWRTDGAEKQVTAEGKGAYKTVLLAGVDEAGENTDMLMLCSLNKEEGSVKLVQIPRDTYYRTGKSGGKINRIYRSNLSKYGKKRAAEELCAEIEAAFDIPLDGFVVFDAKTVKAFVDLIGGVPVNVPFDISYFDGKTGEERIIRQGEQTLSGEEAVAFVRHRKSYAEGDLGRLDAQMRFLSGVASVLPSIKKIDRMVTIYQKIFPNLLTNLTEKDIMEVMIAYLKNKGVYSLSLMRLPGEACYTNGSWYYTLYRDATQEMLRHEMGRVGAFDPECRFTDTEEETLSNIYFSSVRSYRVYTPEEIASKKILHT